jgi:hypothetical protein
VSTWQQWRDRRARRETRAIERLLALGVRGTHCFDEVSLPEGFVAPSAALAPSVTSATGDNT